MTLLVTSFAEKKNWLELIDSVTDLARKGSPRAKRFFSSPTWLKVSKELFTDARINYIELQALATNKDEDEDEDEPIKPKPTPESTRKRKLASYHKRKAEKEAAKLAAQKVIPTIRNIVWPSDKGVSNGNQNIST
jgi:hypothetical protein